MTQTAVTPMSLHPSAEAEAPARTSHTRKVPPVSRRHLVGAAALLVSVLGGMAWYRASAGRESTDDAQVDAEVVAVPSRAAGITAHIYFVENQAVKAGDLLATLDDEAAKGRLAQADAAVASALATAEAADADARVAETNAKGNKAAADATLATSAAAVSAAKNQMAEAAAAQASVDAILHQAQVEERRSRELYQAGGITRMAMDQSETSLAVAKSNADATRARLATLGSGIAQATSRVAESAARAEQSNDVASLVSQARARANAAHATVASAQAARDLAALELSYTRILAPHDGIVSKKTIAEGQAVAVAQPIVELVTPGVWVTANFKETQLEQVRVGQRVEISIDAFSSEKIQGEVESLSGATGSRFTLLPPDNAAGNYTKIVQRLPVRIRVTAPPERLPLRPGLSADVTIFTRG